MVLSDLGARVIRIERLAPVGPLFGPSANDLLNRGRDSVVVDLKSSVGADIVMRSVAISDALIEGFRPGVTERLGIGPAHCLARNPALVYARMTGWGQTGPRSSMAGHDIDYIALSGALHPVGPADRPIPPLNLVGDFGGGGMLLAVGVLAGVIHARATGEGQVVDASMVDGSALLTTSHHGYMADGWWTAARESNLPTNAFYRTHGRSPTVATAAVGALEPPFFAALLQGLEIDAADVGAQDDRERWPEMRDVFARRFITRNREEWADHFMGSDACVAPVLSLREAPSDIHVRSRGTFVEVNGVVQPAPAPRFDRTPANIRKPPGMPGADTDRVLADLGFSPDEVSRLRASGAVA
jgi:alpha-methylacyl-CoA racemase